MRKLSLLAALFLSVALLTGCIRTRLLVLSDPPGAKVTMNDKVYGHTPVEIMAGWYWYYEFELEKKGYQDLLTEVSVKPRIYQRMPLDFIAEIIPIRFLDEREFSFELTPVPEEHSIEAIAAE